MMKERLWLLLGKKVSGEIDAEELGELEQLLRSSGEITFAGELMERLWQAPLVPAQTDESGDHNWAAIAVGIEEKESIVRSMQASVKWIMMAASFVLLVASGIGGYWWTHRSAVEQTEAGNSISTRPDSRSRISLPDGTTVWLNSDSKIAYNKQYGEHKREITLTGEAFFDVVQNAGMPLVVHAKGLNIQVLGTAFNVTAYAQDSEVTTSLIRGSVELSAPSKPGWRVLLQPNQKISVPVDPLTPGALDSGEAAAKVHPEASGTYALKPEPRSRIIPEVSWVDNKLVFYQEPFGSLALRMERWFRVQFQIRDEQLKKVTLTGIFDKESLNQALTALQLSCRFHYVIKDDTVTITR